MPTESIIEDNRDLMDRIVQLKACEVFVKGMPLKTLCKWATPEQLLAMGAIQDRSEVDWCFGKEEDNAK